MDKDLQAKLQPLRETIDRLDREILALVNERARTAQAVGQHKHAHHEKGPVFRPEREAQVIRNLQEINPGPIGEQAIDAIWSQIISVCRGLEKEIRVAYLGPAGSFSEQAAFEFMGQDITGVPCPNFDEVFRCVESDGADVGIVPVENSTEGAVNRTLDLLLNSSLRIVGEHTIMIRHCLLTQTGSTQGVTRVLAHPQALAQCQNWLGLNLPGLSLEPVASNAQAAQLASQDPTIAAIASDIAARAWDLHLVAQGIQDDPMNRTRFLAVGKIDNLPSGHDKTSLILAVPNEAGAVYRMLAPLSQNGVSMTRFESRPARTGQWEYLFYVDIEGHRQDPQVAKSLDELQSSSAFFKVLGSYPRQPVKNG
jgi:chorismate mutase / prephenate dehydratase